MTWLAGPAARAGAAKPDRPGNDARDAAAPTRLGIIPVALTLLTAVAATFASWTIWEAFMAAPWTRDGRVRAYTVTIAPEVSGRIITLPVADNQFVRKGDVLMVIDPTDYAIAVSLGEAQVQQQKTTADNNQVQSQRREQLTTLSTSVEERQNFASSAAGSAASLGQALSNLAQARTNLERTRIVSPVNGWVTNLLMRQGNYAAKGTLLISVVDADSFWIDGYFEETNLGRIAEGDPVQARLLGFGRREDIVHGHVESVSRAITVTNAQPDAAGLANVNPIFTWVRLAQRVPVRIHIDTVPAGVRLVAGLTATVQVDQRTADPK